MKSLVVWVSLPAILLVISGLAAAQDADDLPSHVARIAYIAGPVSFEPAGVDQFPVPEPER